MCTIRKKLLWVYWLSLLPTSKWLFSFLYIVLSWATKAFFFFNLTLIYFSSSFRLKQWKELFCWSKEFICDFACREAQIAFFHLLHGVSWFNPFWLVQTQWLHCQPGVWWPAALCHLEKPRDLPSSPGAHCSWRSQSRSKCLPFWVACESYVVSSNFISRVIPG